VNDDIQGNLNIYIFFYDGLVTHLSVYGRKRQYQRTYKILYRYEYSKQSNIIEDIILSNSTFQRKVFVLGR